MIAKLSWEAPTWWRSLLLVFWVCLCAYPQAAPPSYPDNILIQAAGHQEIYLMVGGTKRHIQSRFWTISHGFGSAALHILPPSEVAAIPTGNELSEEVPVPRVQGAFEGMLLASDDGRVWLVRHGERHWIRDGRWIAESRYAGQTALRVSDAELQTLPLGGDIVYASLAAKIAFVLVAAVIFLFLLLSTSNRARALIRLRFDRFAGNILVRKWTTWHSRALLTVLFALAIAMREPYLLQHPRFWAEEGLVWFQYGSQHSFVKTLFYVYPITNYFTLAPNLGALLSSRTAATFGLEYAPLATTLFAFLIQVLAIASILFVKSHLFDSLWKALAGCMIVLFATTTTDELWLNSINSISFLGMISLVLLFGETESWPRWLRWGARATLVVCGLSSPYSAALLPLFLVLAWRYKQREQKVQCVILLFCVLVQAGVVVNSRTKIMKAGMNPLRGVNVRLAASAINIFVEHMAYPALGYPTRERLLDVTGLKEASMSVSTLPPPPLTHSVRAQGCLCFLLIVGILMMLRGPTLFSMANMMIVAFLLLSSFTCIASLSSVPTGRYAFLPGVTFLLLLLINSESPNSRLRRYVSMSLLSYGLAAGIVAYQTPKVQEGPSWSKEVQIWEANPSHALRVWPSYYSPETGITYTKRTAR